MYALRPKNSEPERPSSRPILRVKGLCQSGSQATFRTGLARSRLGRNRAAATSSAGSDQATRVARQLLSSRGMSTGSVMPAPMNSPISMPFM